MQWNLEIKMWHKYKIKAFYYDIIINKSCITNKNIQNVYIFSFLLYNITYNKAKLDC